MADLRQRILQRACDLYLRTGLDGFSMRKLARELGVTAPALYRHYDGREAVLADVVREAHKVFMSYIYRALEAPTPLERMWRAGEGYLDFALEHPRWYAIMFSGPERLGMEALPDDIEAMGCAIHQFWIDRVSECMRAGILKQGDPLAVSLTMWAHAHGMVELYQQGRLPIDERGFRALFEESGLRLMVGVAADAFEAAHATADAPASVPARGPRELDFPTANRGA
jgi:AcrR family transcriptional regulator